MFWWFWWWDNPPDTPFYRAVAVFGAFCLVVGLAALAVGVGLLAAGALFGLLAGVVGVDL